MGGELDAGVLVEVGSWHRFGLLESKFRQHTSGMILPQTWGVAHSLHRLQETTHFVRSTSQANG